MKKIAIVTGGSSGIGLGIVKNLLAEKIQTISWDINPSAEDVPYIHCDVTDFNSVQKAYKETLEKYGAPNIIINNCGLQFMSKIEDFPIEKWNQLISIMLTGTFYVSKVTIPEMKKQNWGRIINISSIHGKVASPFKSAYVSAKHGVLGLSKVMALELAENNITVNSICPGFVDTPLMRKQVTSQAELNKISEEKVISDIMLQPQCVKKFTSIDQISGMVKFFISEDAGTITGEAFNMSGGWGMGV